jgi:putative transposase
MSLFHIPDDLQMLRILFKFVTLRTGTSYAAQALGRDVKMWTPHAEYEGLGSTKNARQTAYRRLFKQELGADLISEIKHAQQTGFALGTEKFRQQFEELTGHPQSHKKRGRKPSGYLSAIVQL